MHAAFVSACRSDLTDRTGSDPKITTTEAGKNKERKKEKTEGKIQGQRAEPDTC